MVESEPELISTGIAFDVQLIAQVFQADYVVKHGLVSFAELKNGKRIYREPMISFERQYLYCDVWQLGDIWVLRCFGEWGDKCAVWELSNQRQANLL